MTTTLFSVLPCILKCLWIVEKGDTLLAVGLGTVEWGEAKNHNGNARDVIKGRKVKGNLVKIRNLLVKK